MVLALVNQFVCDVILPADVVDVNAAVAVQVAWMMVLGLMAITELEQVMAVQVAWMMVLGLMAITELEQVIIVADIASRMVVVDQVGVGALLEVVNNSLLLVSPLVSQDDSEVDP